MSAADVVELADLVSEADMHASKPLADLLNQFMYDNPDADRQLDIWGTFQNAARDELEVDRLQRPSKRGTSAITDAGGLQQQSNAAEGS